MDIPLDEVVHFDVCTHDPSTAGVSDADSAPTFDVFEEASDTPILDDQTMTKRTSLTGNYRGTFTMSAANGFEVGKWYNVITTATVGGVTAKDPSMRFRCGPAESAAGYVKVDVQYLNGGNLSGNNATFNLKKLNVVNPDVGGVAVNFEASGLNGTGLLVQATSTTLGTALSLLANTPATGVAANVNGTASSFNITGQVLYGNVEVYDKFFTFNTGETYSTAVAGSVVKEIADNAATGGLIASAIADAVWDEARAGHVTAGSFGEGINAVSLSTAALQQFYADDVNAVGGDVVSGSIVGGIAEALFVYDTDISYGSAVAQSVVKEIADNAAAGAATDPLESQVPGSYASGTAGHRLGMLGGVKVTVVSPVADTGELTLVRGDAYTSRLGRALTFTDARDTWPDLTDGVVTLEVGDGLIVATGVVVTATGAGKTVRVDVRSSETDLLTQDRYDYNLVVTYPGTGTTAADGGDRATLVSAEVVAVDREDA